MRIFRDNQIKNCKVKELESMRAYLILDSDNQESVLFINHDKGYCFTIRNYENAEGLCCLHINKDDEVKVIAQIENMDITNLKLSNVA